MENAFTVDGSHIHNEFSLETLSDEETGLLKKKASSKDYPEKLFLGKCSAFAK